MRRRPSRVAQSMAIVLACGFAAAAAAAVDVSGPARGIAVMPFAAGAPNEGERLPDVASLLAGALSARSSARVVAPESLRRDDRGLDDPEASDVRRWAQWNAVENVVVGRTTRNGDGLDVAIELRSAHSGAARAEYRLAPSSGDDLPRTVERVAGLILADLGEGDPGPDSLPPVAAAPPPVGAAAEAAASASDGEIDLALLPSRRRDDPISINSDELEVLPQDGGRRLVFSRNVEVLQGDVTLHADRLEAVYPQGASQPELLLASGRVRVAQGDRRARCDEASYERAAQTIVCRGKAEVLQGCDRVRGEQIEFDLENERVHVSGAASVVIQSQSQSGDRAECAAMEEGSQ